MERNVKLKAENHDLDGQKSSTLLLSLITQLKLVLDILNKNGVNYKVLNHVKKRAARAASLTPRAANM